MAQDRTNMVSLFDAGCWLGGKTSNILEMGDGFNELTEDWSPSFADTQYINMKNGASSLNGYAFSMTPEREHLSDEFQSVINEGFKKFPTGSDAESFYYRFYKTDAVEGSENTFKAIRVPIVCGPASTGGSAGEALTSSIEIHGNGDVKEGTITVTVSEEKVTFTWSDGTTQTQTASAEES